MKLAFAVNKISKAVGTEPTKNEHGNILTWKAGRYTVSVYRNGDGEEVALIHARHTGDTPDSMSDYFPGSYFDSIPQLLRYIA